MAVETMAALGWASLPADLVNRVADCLLATNDLDCYTDMRAVCHHWRSVTADPRSNQHDARFRPSRWIMLDEHKASAAAAIDALLFVNTATGRFLRRSLPLLRDPGHAFVTSTTDGLLVLAATEPPHAVSVLNPFTGSLIRFTAPMPRYPGPRLTADVVGSSPTLFLVSVATSCVLWADPKSESFSIDKRDRRDCPASRLPQIAAAGKYADAVNGKSVRATKDIFDQLRSEVDESCRCYAVVAAGGDMLAVLKRRRGIEVFKIDVAGNMVERMESIGSQALFLGVRCLVVDTDRFPTLEPNCAYFQRSVDLGQPKIYKFTTGIFGEQEPEFVSAATDHFCPLTVTQFLSNYTMDIPWHSLPPLERCSSYLEENDYVDEEDCYGEYTDIAHDEYLESLGDNIADMYGSGSEHDDVDIWSSASAWDLPDDVFSWSGLSPMINY